MPSQTRSRGSKRMKENGLLKIELWVDEALFEKIAEIARSQCRTRAALLKELLDNWAWMHRFMTNAEIAELAKKELENRR